MNYKLSILAPVKSKSLKNEIVFRVPTRVPSLTRKKSFLIQIVCVFIEVCYKFIYGKFKIRSQHYLPTVLQQ